MANDAHISLYGTVVQDPTVKQFNEKPVLSMRVAVKTTKKQENSKWNATDLYDVSLWYPAEYLVNQIRTKTKVIVYGDFMIGEPWTDKSGKEHVNLRVTANSVNVVSGGNYNNNNNYTPQQQVAAVVEEEAPF